MARLWLDVKEWVALKEAAERVPPEQRSEALKSALEGVHAVIGAVNCARQMLKQEDS